MFFRKEKKEKGKASPEKSQKPRTREEIINDPNMPESISKMLQEQADINKKQEAQYSALRKAKELGEEGKSDEAISIAEKIMYEEGCMCVGVSWPFILSDLYLKNNMNNECWKYLNFIALKYPEMTDKIDEVRIKILRQEGRHLEALASKMQAILFKYSQVEFKPTEEKIEKDLNPFIKRSNMIERKSELLSLMKKYLHEKPYEITNFRNDLKGLIKK